MKSLLTAAILSVAAVGAASAATLNAVDMKQNEWIVLDRSAAKGGFTVTPDKADGSFSYSVGYADSLCPQSWACMPQSASFNTVYASGGDFGYGWSPQSFASVITPVTLGDIGNSLYLFFRVTSGTAGVSWTAAVSPAQVPLPATALLLLGGIGAVGALRLRRKKAQ